MGRGFEIDNACEPCSEHQTNHNRNIMPQNQNVITDVARCLNKNEKNNGDKKPNKNVLKPVFSLFKLVLPNKKLSNNKVYDLDCSSANDSRKVCRPLTNNLNHRDYYKSHDLEASIHQTHYNQKDGSLNIDKNNNNEYLDQNNNMNKETDKFSNSLQDNAEASINSRDTDSYGPSNVLRKKPSGKMAYTYHGRQRKLHTQLYSNESEKLVKEITVSKSGKIKRKTGQEFLNKKFVDSVLEKGKKDLTGSYSKLTDDFTHEICFDQEGRKNPSREKSYKDKHNKAFDAYNSNIDDKVKMSRKKRDNDLNLFSIPRPTTNDTREEARRPGKILLS